MFHLISAVTALLGVSLMVQVPQQTPAQHLSPQAAKTKGSGWTQALPWKTKDEGKNNGSSDQGKPQEMPIEGAIPTVLDGQSETGGDRALGEDGNPAGSIAEPAVKAEPLSPPDPLAGVYDLLKRKPYMRVWLWPPSRGGQPSDGVHGSTGSDGAPLHGTTSTASMSAPYPLGGQHGAPMTEIRFPTNSSSVFLERFQEGGLAKWLKENPDRAIVLDGYADSRGSKVWNASLAQKRADEVKRRLVGLGASEKQITARGHGASNPVAGATNEETWWLSRRVMVRVENSVPEM